MKDIFIVTSHPKIGWDAGLKIGSVSRLQSNMHGRVHFDNGSCKMIGTGVDIFYQIHTPVKEYVKNCLEGNRLEEIFQIFKELGVGDTALMQGNYSAAIQHRNNGGSFESVENKLASVRVWINDTIKKW